MPSSAKIGAYYKTRSRKWLEARGWQVADMEVVRTVWTRRHSALKSFAIKRDQFGSDLLAMDSTQCMFVQVKGGKTAVGNFPLA